MREIPAKRGRVNRYGTLPSYIFYEAPLMGQERHNPTGTSDLTLSFIFEESLLCPRCYACLAWQCTIPVNPPPFRGNLPHGLGLMRGSH
jgi:hypothetical protein